MKDHYRYWDEDKLKKALNEPLSSLALDESIINALDKAGIIKIEELLNLSQEQLLNVRNLGPKKQIKIMKALKEKGFY